MQNSELQTIEILQTNTLEPQTSIINNKINLKNIDPDTICLGIDFGTTNSCLSIWYKNKSIIVPDIDGNDIIPTVIEINLDKKIIGKEAYVRKDIFEKTNDSNVKNIFLIYEIKKLLGKKYSDLDKNYINMIAYNILSDQDDNIVIHDNNSGKLYYPEEIAIHIFMSFKVRAEKYFSQKFNQEIIISNAVVTVPAYFNKNQRQIIKNSAENAGLNVIRLINEPTAAAICYGLGKNFSSDQDNSEGINIIVFDFGGGTLDVSLLNINNGIYEVLGSCGNNNLGGSDFDRKIMEFCINKFIEQNNLDSDEFIEKVEENSLQKLKYLCEQAKIALSDNNNTNIRIPSFYDQIDMVQSFNREDFELITQDLIRLIIKPINDVLDNCELEKTDIKEIIMVGGMTRVPIVRYNIERFFNRDVNCSIDPDTVVSIGASIHGHMLLNKATIQDKLLLIDRTSLSIGLETSGGIMDTLISRGTIIPVKKIKKYTTDTDFMESIDIKIFEGERKFTKDNFLIGSFTLTGIEKQKRGIPEIQITFEIDSDGIIKIKAEDLDNPLNKKSIQVSGNKQNLSQEQIEQIIISAKQMDQIDRIDKIKKESYLSLIDSSKKIIENLNSDEVQIPQETKNDIINNVQEILSWLESNKYDQIDIDKYKELLHDYKINYSIYMIQQITPIINLESAEDEDNKGIEIYEDDNNSKKYAEQIKYFRNIIDEYDNIKKQINILKHLEINKDFKDFESNIVQIENNFEEVNDYANDILIRFFIDKNINDGIVEEYVTNLYNLDVQFKEYFEQFNEEFNIVNKFINKIKEKEDSLLKQLEILTNSTDFNLNDNVDKNKDQIENSIKNDYSIENADGTNLEDICQNIVNNLEPNNQEIDNINSKLDVILEFQSFIYKIDSGYVKTDLNKINHMINVLEKM